MELVPSLNDKLRSSPCRMSVKSVTLIVPPGLVEDPKVTAVAGTETIVGLLAGVVPRAVVKFAGPKHIITFPCVVTGARPVA
jgi:hypothetical protein